jgi:hypothetical protein
MYCTRGHLKEASFCLHHVTSPIAPDALTGQTNRALLPDLSIAPRRLRVNMAQPMSPLTPRSVNRNYPSTTQRKSPYKSQEKAAFAHHDTENMPLSSPGGPPSSPFVENVESPLAKVSQNLSEPQSIEPKSIEDYQRIELTEGALRENEGSTRTVQVLEDNRARDDDTVKTTGNNGIDDESVSNVGGAPGYAGMDDTAFSAFSAVPNADMTRFARLGQSPTKNTFGSPAGLQHEEPTPRPTDRNTPSRNRYYDDSYSSTTPRRNLREKPSHGDDTTNLLVDFTGNFSSIAPLSQRSLTWNGRMSPPGKYHNDLASYASGRRTPSPTKYALPPSTPSESRHLTNLLDFDLPPAPTPRSVPSISARELESMKSAFQSQISSLKAELSGKEAEVNSLKNAMDNAERRVGEAQEQVREERGAKEGLQAEKTEWEKREQEMKDVLRSVKEEIVHSDREKDGLLQRATNAEYKREEAETKAMEAESKVAGLQAGASSESTATETGRSNTSSEVEAAVTKVATELHGLYKSKHEAKVTALKKSYSDRWEKRMKDLQSKIEELGKENEDLRIGRDATMTGVDPGRILAGAGQESEEHRKEREALQQRCEGQTSKLQSVERELATLKCDLALFKDANASLQSQLDLSRTETAELIAATEELMALSQSAMSSSESQPPSAHSDTRSALSRSTSGTGLKAPGFGGYSGESRIGGIRPPTGGYSGGYGSGYGKERSGSGSGVKSGLLGNIERMGRGGGVH